MWISEDTFKDKVFLICPQNTTCSMNFTHTQFLSFLINSFNRSQNSSFKLSPLRSIYHLWNKCSQCASGRDKLCSYLLLAPHISPPCRCSDRRSFMYCWGEKSASFLRCNDILYLLYLVFWRSLLFYSFSHTYTYTHDSYGNTVFLASIYLIKKDASYLL